MEALRGFGFTGVLVTLVILLAGNFEIRGMIVFPIGATLALGWVWLTKTPWSELGFVRPRYLILTIAAAVILGAVLKLAMKAIVMPLLGAPAINTAYQHMTGNVELLPWAIWAMFVAGFSEEIVFRGFLFERLRTLLGSDAVTGILVVGLSSAVFAAAHLVSQGIWGATQAFVVALVFGSYFWRWRQIWPLMAAHTSFDLTALALIYYGIEEEVASSVWCRMC